MKALALAMCIRVYLYVLIRGQRNEAHFEQRQKTSHYVFMPSCVPVEWENLH